MKQIAQTLFLLAFIYGAIEAISYGFFYFASGMSFNQDAINALTSAANGKKQTAVQSQPGKLEYAVHPYTGYVYEPKSWNSLMSHDGITVNSFGLVDDKSPIQQKDPSKLIVGIFGGSVAWWFSKHGADELIEEIKRTPAYEDKEIILVRAALGGYKQPQQLLSLSYLLSQGAEFDIIINLDGLNEINVPISGNLPKHVHPFYPQNWYLMTEKFPNEEVQKAIGKIGYLSDSRRDKANWLQNSIFRYSPLTATLWTFSDRNLANELGQARIALQEVSTNKEEVNFATSGPPYQSQHTDAMPDLVEMWERSSWQMSQLAKANKIRYFHYLQPNQYVAGSKPMGAKEREVAFAEHSLEKLTVGIGYPALKKRGEALKRRGVHFVDLTDSFKNIEEHLYIDTCCHLNDKGSSILGRIVGKDIAES